MRSHLYVGVAIEEPAQKHHIAVIVVESTKKGGFAYTKVIEALQGEEIRVNVDYLTKLHQTIKPVVSRRSPKVHGGKHER